LSLDARLVPGRSVQVPPLVLAVCNRRAAEIRLLQRQRPGGLAPAALQSLESRRSGLRVTYPALLQPLEHLFRHILNGLHQVGLPWAWSIVALTVIVRMLLVPLTVRQIHSMQNMQRFAPQMKEIQKKYKGDRQKLNEELMKFYKENSIN